MEPIINPVDVSLLKAELTAQKRLRGTNKGHNELYVVTAANSPNLMREIGRLRELSFRAVGEGSGKAADVDDFDFMDDKCQQLLVWDPDGEAVVGGYRFICGNKMEFGSDGQPVITSAHLFHYSEKFIKEYLPYTIELGRAFVSPRYQSANAGLKALFALDNLWDGLAALIMAKPGMRYYLGKMTISPSFNPLAKDLILHFLNKHFGDSEALVRPFNPLSVATPAEQLEAMLPEKEFKADYTILKKEVRALGVEIPPLVNSYMSISPSVRIFGTAVNDEFADALETGILVDFNDIYYEKKVRHVDSFIKERTALMKLRFPALGASNTDVELGHKIAMRRERRLAMRQQARLSPQFVIAGA